MNTDYWVDSTDTINVSAGETSRVHSDIAGVCPAVGTTDPGSPDPVPLVLSGQNLRDPTDTQNSRRYSGATLWGSTGTVSPTAVAQGGIGDCYFLSGLQAAGRRRNPQVLQDHIVDLGDGTYAVDYVAQCVHSIYRVDGDFSYPNATNYENALWPLVAEKAFAFFRNPTDLTVPPNTYSSLSSGWLPEIFNAFNVPVSYFSPTIGFSYLQNALSQDKAVTFATTSSIPAGVALVPSHAYA